jgi:hypothetical protein
VEGNSETKLEMKFLVLDLDQILIDDYPSAELVCAGTAVANADGYAIYIRPHVDEFPSWAFQFLMVWDYGQKLVESG